MTPTATRTSCCIAATTGSLAVLAPRGAEAPPDIDGVAWEVSRFSEPIELSTAVAEMDALNHRFLYFTDAASGRGCVLYLRYDGHYGLIEPSASGEPR